jgi:plastocyanin
MRRASILIVAVAGLITLVLAGCGDSEPPSPPPGTIAMREYEFVPKHATVDRGDTITVANQGKIAHNLVVEKRTDPLGKVEKLIGTDTFLGGRSESLRVDLPPGSYTIVSSVPGQRQLGMYGTLTVR